MTTPTLRSAKTNRLLASLPGPSLNRILRDLRIKPLEMRQVLQPRNTPLKEVVFPVQGVASMVSVSGSGRAGDAVEVATIGCEGMVGLPLFLGGEKAAAEIFIQVPGEGLHLSAMSFRAHVKREPALVRTLLLYTQALLTQVAQCAVCNAHHPVEARCARWLLQTHDRVTGDVFPLTQSFLGKMLGVRRESVTVTAGVLQKRKLIRYTRGVITVLNRKGLEAAACKCYQLITNEYDRLLGASDRVSEAA